MSHIRQQVREAIAAVLAASSVSWRSVIESRVASTRQIWPYVMVFSTGDSLEVISVNDPTIYSRTINIAIVGMLRIANTDTITIEDKMDVMALEVETKLTNAAIRAVLPGIESLAITSTSLDLIVTDDDAIDHAEVTITCEVICANAENAPSTIL
jgi:hypothetical protein